MRDGQGDEREHRGGDADKLGSRDQGPARDLAAGQRDHWQDAYTSHPGMYGTEPSAPAIHAAGVFRTVGAEDVVELGAGHGRDSLYFAREGFTVRSTDFSPVGLSQLEAASRAEGLAERITTTVHDVREPLPLPDASVDAVFAHMLLCMALSTEQIHALVGEVRRVLRPGGVFVYTVRHTGDAHYGTGIAHGDDIHEHGGFAVHFFPRRLVDDLAEGWDLVDVHAFEEGDLPRRLWRVTQIAR
ncbi:class I SAM-dependent methyltransferase [Streptomyces sp. NPDC046805]|uniref:class I SAM-dependent methyltransferase n=1 Tax=Streptomyces sp. NPDC046805 TaxID=3155134 RepID=UPI0033EB3FB0